MPMTIFSWWSVRPIMGPYDNPKDLLRKTLAGLFSASWNARRANTPKAPPARCSTLAARAASTRIHSAAGCRNVTGGSGGQPNRSEAMVRRPAGLAFCLSCKAIRTRLCRGAKKASAADGSRWEKQTTVSLLPSAYLTLVPGLNGSGPPENDRPPFATCVLFPRFTDKALVVAIQTEFFAIKSCRPQISRVLRTTPRQPQPDPALF